MQMNAFERAMRARMSRRLAALPFDSPERERIYWEWAAAYCHTQRTREDAESRDRLAKTNITHVTARPAPEEP
jgi:hypothetical protein